MTTFTPAPKPAPRSPRIAKRISPCSEKQLATRKAAGEKVIVSTIKPKTEKQFKPRHAVSINRKKRKPSEFARIYGSRERVRWVKSEPCIATLGGKMAACYGPIDNAHVTRDDQGGTGRKSGYRCIAPCCRRHHNILHVMGARFFEENYAVSLEAQAMQTEARWQLHCGRLGISPESGKAVRP